MNKTNNRNTVPMEDEDLEFLRLAALKTIEKKSKKNAPQSSASQPQAPSSSRPTNGLQADRPLIPFVGHVVAAEPFHGPSRTHPPSTNSIAPYHDTSYNKIDSTERFTDYYASNIEPTNVQLSPRSAAFVAENKQIIKRRQESSPTRQSHRRASWSRSPSPNKWKYDRSASRSPIYSNNSPHFRGARSGSRSPVRRRYSPGRKSPDRRSPGSHAIRRNHSPLRNDKPIRRANSPYHSNNTSPRGDEAAKRGRTNRARSPHQDLRRRSTSRSPIRKFPRANAAARRGRKPSSPKRFQRGSNNMRARNNKMARRSNSPAPNRRSTSKSPAATNHRRQASPRQEKSTSGHRNNSEPSRSLDEEKATDASRIGEAGAPDETPIAVDSNGIKKTEDDLENELLASSGDEKSDSDGDESDGIDLFASEESESENEGRFKLSSTKTESKPSAPVVSFSELGKTKPSTVLRDLDELQADMVENRRRDRGRRRPDDRNGRDSRRTKNRATFSRVCDRDRERERNKDKERERFRERERERDRDKEKNKERERDQDRNKDREKGLNRKKHANNEIKKPELDTADTKHERKPIIFKSTSKSAERDGAKSSELEKHSSETKDKSSTEKRSAATLKRTTSKPPEKETSSKSIASSVIKAKSAEKQREQSQPDDSGDSSAAAKKPIHLRLGAMTKTWKPNKKWKTEKV